MVLVVTGAPYGAHFLSVSLSTRKRAAPDRIAIGAARGPKCGIQVDRVAKDLRRLIASIEEPTLHAFLRMQRWFGGKARSLATVRMGAMPIADAAWLTFVDVRFDDGVSERYVVPLAVATGDEGAAIRRERPAAVRAMLSDDATVYDAFQDGFCLRLLALARGQSDLTTPQARLVGTPTAVTSDSVKALRPMSVMRRRARATRRRRVSRPLRSPPAWPHGNRRRTPRSFKRTDVRSRDHRSCLPECRRPIRDSREGRRARPPIRGRGWGHRAASVTTPVPPAHPHRPPSRSAPVSAQIQCA
jgi:hypothetical protein